MKLTGSNTTEKVKQLENRINECSQVHDQIMGANLFQNLIRSPLIKTEMGKDILQKEFTEYMTETIGPDEFKSTDEMAAAIMKVLNLPEVVTIYVGDNNSVQSGGKVREGKTLSQSGIKRVNQILISDLTEVQKKRAAAFVKAYKQEKISVEVKADRRKVESTLDWLDITKKDTSPFALTETEARALSEDDLEKKRKQIIELICSYAPKLREVAEEVILTKKANIFFGKNIAKEITGLIGEILGLFYIRTIFQENNVSQLSADWIGGLFDTTKPHADLILTEVGKNVGYGIQVKNTASDIEDGILSDITFASAQADTFFSYLKADDLTQADMDAVSRTYSMYSFNQEYHYDSKNKKYYAEDNEAFHGTRLEIEKLKRQMDYVMSIFAADLMYITTEEQFKDITSKGNIMYFLGGNNVKMASEIMLEIIRKIQSQQSTGFKISARYNNSPSNIIEYFNLKHNDRPKARTAAIGELILTSSYSFSL